MSFQKFLFICLLMVLVPTTIGEESENYLRLIDNIDQMINQLQEANQINKRDLNDLVERKTQQLRNLMLEQKLSLARLPSEIISKLARENLEREEPSADTCPLQRAMLNLFRENPGNVTSELFSRVTAASECSKDSTEEEEAPGETCHPVPMYPEDTVELFKLKARGRRTCSNLSPVQGLNKCHGGCSSESLYMSRGRRMRVVTNCFCCQPESYEKIDVLMTCNNGANFTKTYDNIVACRCLKCRDNGSDEDSDDEDGERDGVPRPRRVTQD